MSASQELLGPSDSDSIDMADLIRLMQNCWQTPNQSVYEHGRSVWEHFKTLLDDLRGDSPAPSWWRIPAWAREPGILDRLPPHALLEQYATFHDCGKPFTLQIDAGGKRHFPGHAATSERIWLAAGGDPLAAKLMGMDMDAHLLKADTLPEFAARPEAETLLLMALAEIHSNAELFGGQDSDGFKIKAKHLDKRGAQTMKIRIRK